MPLHRLAVDVLAEAGGRAHRADSVAPRTGGPAGNARLTAWTGIVLLALFLVELFTTLDVEGMLTWHVAVGAVLVPIALSKTASTTWRFARYYSGHRAYQQAGPPPTLLRFLGPLVVLSTLGLLISGVTLIIMGPTTGRRSSVWALGLDMLTVHQALFIAFCATTGLHVLARFVPAVLLVSGHVGRDGAVPRQVPGRAGRLATLALAVAVGALTAVLVVHGEGAWQHDRHVDRGPRAGAAALP
jgi:hypothetical protein